MSQKLPNDLNEKAKLCDVDTESFLVHVKTDSIYKDIAEDVETRSAASNYEIDRPLPMGKNQKVVVLMKDKLGGKILKKFAALKTKTYSYLKHNKDEYKKQRTQKGVS